MIKWLPRLSLAKFSRAQYLNLFIIYQSTSEPNLVLLDKSEQFGRYFGLNRRTIKCIRVTELDESFVLNELLKLDSSKAVGIDDLHPRLLKFAAPFIASTRTVLFNKLKNGCFPTEFQIAKITPIHKGGNRMDLRNYRSISVLPSISKILEKAVHQQLYTYLKLLLSERQSSFRPGHSTVTCLTEMIENILDNIDKGQVTGAIFSTQKEHSMLYSTTLFFRKCLTSASMESSLSGLNRTS